MADEHFGVGGMMVVFQTIGRRVGLLTVVAAGLCLAGCAGGLAVPSVVSPTSSSAVDAPAGSNEDFIVNVGRRVYFSANSAELNEADNDTLKLQLEWLTKYSGYKIKIEGFADDPGSADANLKLGIRRAEAVKTWFVANGLAAARIRTKSFGNSPVRLVSNCTDGSCSAQNRRAVTVLDTEVGS